MIFELEQEYAARIGKVREETRKRGFSCLMIFGLAPRRVGDLMYLTGHQPLLPGHPRRYGFKGRGYSVILLPIEEEPCLLTTTPFFEKDLFIKKVIYGDDLPEEIGKSIKSYNLERADIGIVGMDILAVSLFEDIKKELYQARFFQADDIVMNLRAAKSKFEINLLRMGAKISDEVAIGLREYLRPGITERDVFNYITKELSIKGVTGAYATCQSGWRSEVAADVIPASDKIIENGDMVHMEINGKFQGYMIDICRSTVVGGPNSKQREILDTVIEMFETSVAAMKPGISAESLEKISGEIALRKGFDHNTTRAYNGPATLLGHAIGLGVDEPPVIAKGDKTLLVPGMVITIEPGIYKTGYGGCRIEDEILVTETGFENLNNSERKWY